MSFCGLYVLGQDWGNLGVFGGGGEERVSNVNLLNRPAQIPSPLQIWMGCGKTPPKLVKNEQ